VDYIKKKEDFYEEGGQVEYQHLMDWEQNKFKTRKESEQWCQRTEEETIIALQAQVNLQMGLDPRSFIFGITLKPSWKTSCLSMWPMRPSRNGQTFRESIISCWLMLPLRIPTLCNTMGP
jgi:hypothetical protein